MNTRELRLREELEFNFNMIKSLKKRLRNVYKDFDNDDDIDKICKSIHNNLKLLYDDCRLLKSMMRYTMNDNLYNDYVKLIPCLYPHQNIDINALYQL